MKGVESVRASAGVSQCQKKGIEKSQDALSRPRNMADERNFTNILNTKQLNECHFLKEVKF